MKKIIFVFLSAVLFVSCKPEEVVTPSTIRKVIYKVEGGTNLASVTYENSQGGTSQVSDCPVPFEIILEPMNKGDFAYISAQNMRDYGSITVRILVDSVEWKKSSSSGAYVIASAYGSLP